jgi:putative ABC transport system permease protein
MLARWLLGSEWRHHPLRLTIAVCAIALGVALGYAIDLINGASVAEFSSALKSLAGESDLQVRASSDYFDEKIYPLVAQQAGVINARPILDLRVKVANQQQSLSLIGIDSLRTGNSDLLPLPDTDQFDAILAADTVFLSSAAQSWLRTAPGQTVRLNDKTLRVAGSVGNARSGQRIALMDIASAQWQFQRLGQLSRIEVRLRQGADLAQMQAQLQALLQPHGAFSVTPLAQQEQKAHTMSRAYRVNLNMLALVALFTGAFLIFSNQALSVMRRRSQFALLRVLGWTQRQLLFYLLLEGLILGLLGSLAGIALGFTLAQLGLQLLGGDLGGGYFSGVTPAIRFAPFTALFFMLLGSVVALAGSALPAWQAAQQATATNLRALPDAPPGRPTLAICALLLAALFTQFPAIGELPLFGYAAIFLLLIGTIALTPRLAQGAFSLLLNWQKPHPVLSLALARLSNQARQSGIALSGLLASFSLMVAMAIMVHSFRFSVDQWLHQVLPAQVYLRTLENPLTPAQQQQIASLNGVARVEFRRIQNLSLDSKRPAVMLIAGKAPDELLLARLSGAAAPNTTPIWVSEAIVDLYGWHVGQIVTLPLASQRQNCQVAGIWRDYGRQFGSIIITSAPYQKFTGDLVANDAALWLNHDASPGTTPGSTPAAVISQIRKLPFGQQLEVAEPGAIRAMSLTIFDRSFAITYLLELAAILIGLFGVATSFSAQTLARIREFGMLRHFGYQKSQIMALLSVEAAGLAALGIAMGALLGYAISLILVYIVNPQSFHWRIQMNVPWGLLLGSAVVLWLAATVSALLSGRQAISTDAIRAVHEE